MVAQTDEEVLACEASLQECLGEPMEEFCQQQLDACYLNAMTDEEIQACEQDFFACASP